MSKQIIKKNGKAVLVNNIVHALLSKFSDEHKEKNTDVLCSAISLVLSNKVYKENLLDKIFEDHTSQKIVKLQEKRKAATDDIDSEIAELRNNRK